MTVKEEGKSSFKYYQQSSNLSSHRKTVLIVLMVGIIGFNGKFLNKRV